MQWLLIIAGLALAVQAKYLTPEVTTEAPSLTPEQIPGPGSRPTHEAPTSEAVAMTSVPSVFSEKPLQQHKNMGWSSPKSGPGAKPTLEAPTISSEPPTVAAIPSLFSAETIQQHKDMGWSLPQGLGTTREAPIGSTEPSKVTFTSEPTTVASIPSLFSAELIQQPKEMGWSLPQPGPGSRPTHVTPATPESTEHPPLTDTPDPATLVQQQTRWFPLSAQRKIRAVPRPLPAHKAHGPRAVLPHGLYPKHKVRG